MTRRVEQHGAFCRTKTQRVAGSKAQPLGMVQLRTATPKPFGRLRRGSEPGQKEGPSPRSGRLCAHGCAGVLGAFTLLELLVAMTLMVVVAACLYTALYTGFRAKRSASLAVEPTALAINAIELIKQDTYGVLPLGGTLAGTFLGTDARGLNGVDADSLEFYTTHIYAGDDQPVGGLGKIELVLEQDSDEDTGYDRESYRLMRKITTNLLSPKAVDAEEQVLCRNVKSLNLRYYDEENGWTSEWDSTADANSLPLAVEIDIQVLHNGTNGAEAPKMRRLIQSFPIPCGGAGQQESASDNAGTAAGQAGT